MDVHVDMPGRISMPNTAFPPNIVPLFLAPTDHCPMFKVTAVDPRKFSLKGALFLP